MFYQIKLNLPAHTTHSINRISLLRIYHTVLKSKYDYGAVIHASAKFYNSNKLNTIHNVTIRLANGSTINTLSGFNELYSKYPQHKNLLHGWFWIRNKAQDLRSTATNVTSKLLTLCQPFSQFSLLNYFLSNYT